MGALPMVVQADRERGSSSVSVERLTALARALGAAAESTDRAAALDELVEAARVVAGADVGLVRVRTTGDRLEAIAVAGPRALAAELEGMQLPDDAVPEHPVWTFEGAPEAVRRTARRAGARAVLLFPLAGATLELYRSGPEFSPAEATAAELAAANTALILRAYGAFPGASVDPAARPALELAGEAFAAALDAANTAAEIVRVAATVADAPAGLLWELGRGGELDFGGSHGLDDDTDVVEARRAAASALEDDRPVHVFGSSVVLRLGHPPLGLLQLLFAPGTTPEREQLEQLTTFGVRAAHALRASARARSLAVELERTRALLAVVGQATAELSLGHTLETAVERVGELLAQEQVAVYVRGEGERLVPGANRGLAGPHTRVAEQLLEIALGPSRRQPVVEIADALVDPRLADARDAARESGIEAAVAAPLLVRNEVVGLLAVYPRRHRLPTRNEAALLPPLASLLAVAVQNAQLHERATDLGRQREAALASERAAAKRLGALYEISRSFAQSLSLEATLDALTETIVDVLDVDAAVIHMPDDRREQVLPRAMHVKDEQLAEATRAILYRPQPFERFSREARPFHLGRRRRLAGTDLLEPFLAKGWTAAVVPVATPAEVIAALTILSFRPGSPIVAETIDAAVAIAGQAALAIDNARLYAQQKQFSDTMQRSLLPREEPESEGLEIGRVYESSARVDVGGDVYDFVTLDDGRLAVVLGDVTGHGVEATADMAMAKFVFRSLAREHPEPADFLAAANDVVVDEIATGKFITMTYLAVDGVNGAVACASAGHPAPRLLLPDGTVRPLEAAGLVLGIDSDQEYAEVRAELPSGATLVVYTDGVIEARRDGELYGTERLDALIAEQRSLPADALARTIADDARRFAGGELADDLAVVVLRRR
ncbi:MAG TPA: SpoIIE family protein phosphatase [Gaiellaceae bacterium]|nr:SpoIIE family protein phosphatase [Gaiellaceae bacterium]